VSRWFALPVAGILGVAGLGLTVQTGVFLGAGVALGTAGAFATGGILLGVAGAVALTVAALYYGSIAYRRLQSKRHDKDPAKKRQAAMEHVREVLGRERAHQLMTASPSQAQQLLEEVQASAPKGLRKLLQPRALLDNNEHMVSSWAAEEIRRAQQHTKDGHIPPSLVQEMAVKLTLPAELVQYLLSCRQWCESNEAYYQTCYRTILATVFKAKVYEANRLPYQKPATAPKAAKNTLYGLLSEPQHAALLQQVQHAPSPQALHPAHITDAQERLDTEERLAALRSGLLQAQVDSDDLHRLLHRMIGDVSFAGDLVVPPIGTVSADKLRWLLVALSDPLRDTQAQPLPAAPVALPVPAPLVSYTVLDEAIKRAGNEERPAWASKPDNAGYRTPNPMGTAKQYLEKPTAARTEAILRALTKLLLKFEKVEVDGKTIERPIVPDDHDSLQAWQLAILKDIQQQSEAIGGHLEEGSDKHKTRKAATTRVNRWADAAKTCATYVQKQLLLETSAQHLVMLNG
jgi:membrane protein implicated in regulation of membrane protease activity